MRYRVRALIEGKHGPRGDVTPESTEHEAVTALFAAMAAELAARYPNEYRQALALRDRPDRPAPVNVAGIEWGSYRLADCGWCGDWFPQETAATRVRECCSNSCAQRLRGWRKRHARTDRPA